MDALQIVSGSVGLFLILLLLFLVFWRRNLTEAEYTFARIVLALAGASFAVLITGFLNVDIRGFIQAGGGFGVFAVIFFFAPAGMRGGQKWQEVRREWRDLRDINDDPEQVNDDDLVRAINAVNDAGKAVSDDPTVLRPFKADFESEFGKLFNKLTAKKYSVAHENTTSDLLLTTAAKQLAKDLT